MYSGDETTLLNVTLGQYSKPLIHSIQLIVHTCGHYSCCLMHTLCKTVTCNIGDLSGICLTGFHIHQSHFSTHDTRPHARVLAGLLVTAITMCLTFIVAHSMSANTGQLTSGRNVMDLLEESGHRPDIFTCCADILTWTFRPSSPPFGLFR